MWRILSNRSIQTALILITYIVFASYIPFKVQQLFYTVSLIIKDILILIMPLTICAFIAKTISAFKKKAILFVVFLIAFEAISNFVAVWYAYGVAFLVAENVAIIEIAPSLEKFNALFYLPIAKPNWWSSDKGAMLGIIIGIIGAFNSSVTLGKAIDISYKYMEQLLVRVFARLIPIFILGFAAQMYQMNLLSDVINNYASLISELLLFLLLYLLLLFIIGSILGPGGSITNLFLHIKNLLPAGGIALTSGCSLSTMPWTIEGTSKNLQNKELAKLIIPATTNIQQIGDCIVNAFLCFLIYRNFFGLNPDLLTWVQFSVVFVLARFVTAAILGGSIFIMLPIYETYLNFNPKMIAIILALNVVLDPIVTSCNVLANGALCRVFEIVWNKCSPKVKK